MAYELKCQNMVLSGDGTMRKCGQTARNCECPDGFMSSPSSDVKVQRSGEVCLCGNNVPAGFPVTKRSGGLVRHYWLPWRHLGQCQVCWREEKLNTISAARSKELTISLAVMGNPWIDVAKGLNLAVFSLVDTCRKLHIWEAGWSYLPELPEPVPNLPKSFSFRVGQEWPPRLPSIEEIQPADPIQSTSTYTMRQSRGLGR